MAYYGTFTYGGAYYGNIFELLTVTPGFMELELYFSEDLLSNSELTNPDNYMIYTIPSPSSSIIPSKVISVTKIGDRTLSLETQDFTKDQNYKIYILPNRIQDIHSNYLLVPYNERSFTATSELPIIQRIIATSEKSFEVLFSKPMLIDGLDDESNYSFDKGLRVLSVNIISSSLVELITSKQTPSEMYTLSIV